MWARSPRIFPNVILINSQIQHCNSNKTDDESEDKTPHSQVTKIIAAQPKHKNANQQNEDPRPTIPFITWPLRLTKLFGI